MNNFRLLRPAACLAVLALLAAPAFAQYGPDDEAETLEAMKPKVEEEAKLPPAPKANDLVPVEIGPTSQQHYAIDAKSLTVSDDHVVRYTVVSTSSAGAKNVSYEGIDCKMRTFKRYAYGSTDGKWVRSRRDAWDRISSLAPNQLHHVLNTQYFCQAGLAAGKAEQILGRIRSGRPLNP